MKIIAPVDNPNEVQSLIDAGASELYCGLDPKEWRNKYTNVASSSRREWSCANLKSFKRLESIIEIAHNNNIPVYLTFNALYTEDQYSLLDRYVEKVCELKLDGLIVADLRLLIKLKKMDTDTKICISTGGTTFNSSTVKFYKMLGAERIILPRHLKLQEIEIITSNNLDMEFEVFIMNSGCKNIDGFCTFHHGTEERLHSFFWKLPRKLKLHIFLLKLSQISPNFLRKKIYSLFCIENPCMLNYDIEMINNKKNISFKKERNIYSQVKRSFSLEEGIDPCGACALTQFVKMNILGVKIVGRGFSTKKKIRDIKFIKFALNLIKENSSFLPRDLKSKIKKGYQSIYHISCKELCFYQE